MALMMRIQVQIFYKIDFRHILQQHIFHDVNIVLKSVCDVAERRAKDAIPVHGGKTEECSHITKNTEEEMDTSIEKEHADFLVEFYLPFPL